MKKTYLLLALFAFCQITYAQFTEKMSFKCHKARDFKNGVIGTEMAVEAIIDIDSANFSLTINFNGETEKLEGELKELTVYDWPKFLENGKTQYKALIRKREDYIENTIVEIESKNGATTINLYSEQDPNSSLQFDVAEYSVAQKMDQSDADAKSSQKKKKKKS